MVKRIDEQECGSKGYYYNCLNFIKIQLTIIYASGYNQGSYYHNNF